MKIDLKLTSIIICAGLLIGCDQKHVDHSKVREEGFVYCGQGTPTTFNPQLVDGGITADALSPQIFDGLLILDNERYTPQPNLATSWAISDDGLTYTFQLKQNVAFQTTPWFTPTRFLDATDVVFSFQRVLDTNHPFHNVSTSQYPWFAGSGLKQLVNSVEAADKQTVVFHLNRPDNTFLSLLSSPFAVVHSAEYGSELIESDHKTYMDSHPVGTGPFKLDTVQIGDYVRLKRHDQYWNGAAKMEQVVFDVAQRGTGTLAKLLLGECDVLNSPISSQIPVIQTQSHITLQSAPAMNASYIAVNTRHPAIHDKNVRRALSFAIDRQKIIDSVYYGRGTVAFNLLPPISWAYSRNTSQVRYDVQYARGLLREAGYENGLELTMSVPTTSTTYDPSPRKTAELIQSYFSDVGVQLNLVMQDSIQGSVYNDDVDLYLTGISGRSTDPDSFLRPALTCSANRDGINLTHWCNDNFDSLLNLAIETDEPRFRLNLYKQLQGIINNNVPVIPIAHGMQFKAYNNTLTGFTINPFHVQPFNHVERLK